MHRDDANELVLSEASGGNSVGLDGFVVDELGDLFGACCRLEFPLCSFAVLLGLDISPFRAAAGSNGTGE